MPPHKIGFAFEGCEFDSNWFNCKKFEPIFIKNMHSTRPNCSFKGFSLLFGLFFLLALTSCFDVIEKIKTTTNGSGDYTLIFNASKSKIRLNSIMQMSAVNGHKVPSKKEVADGISEVEDVFRKTPGITGVKSSLDWQNYIFKYECHFDKIESINKVLAEMKKKYPDISFLPGQMYSFDLTNKVFLANKKSVNQLNYSDLSLSDREMFSKAQFTSVLQFEHTIKSHENKQYISSENSKSLLIRGTISEFIKKQKSLYEKVVLN